MPTNLQVRHRRGSPEMLQKTMWLYARIVIWNWALVTKPNSRYGWSSNVDMYVIPESTTFDTIF